ncbi:MAG: L,D-transpeptidase, partial [Prevotella sp.]|nr:L,D-transpeptidase [Prevotella sp.]
MSKQLVVLFIVLTTLFSCTDVEKRSYQDITLEALSGLKSSKYELSSEAIREQVKQLIKSETSSSAAVKYVCDYYNAGKPLVWIDRHGMDSRADTLLSFVSGVEEMGFKKEIFRVAQIEEDLEKVRNLDFDESSNSVNKVLARLEYNLSRAFMRYSSGQNFGFVNPSLVLNRDPENNSDTARMIYKHQFDVKMQHATDSFYKSAVGVAANGDLGKFLRKMQPKRKLYAKLQERLNSGKLSDSEWYTTLCNMERCRWNEALIEDNCQKYIFVNIPAFMLHAVDGNNVLSMKICCGAVKTKTPLLTSEIVRME